MSVHRLLSASPRAAGYEGVHRECSSLVHPLSADGAGGNCVLEALAAGLVAGTMPLIPAICYAT